ncbi:MAG: FkbM family methyltransferase [Ignavibacteria bacterium]|jgi:hypothetical protein
MGFTFRQKLETFWILIKEPKVLKSLLSLRTFGYLIDVGWFQAFNRGEPVDKNCEPLPWLTYSFIDFIAERLSKEFNAFEFGSGNSTLFFAKRVKQVHSVEHNSEWFKKLLNQLPSNSDLELSISENSEDYIAVIKKSNIKFDIIIIDGIHRVECCYCAPDYLSSKGVIILDDSERNEYLEGRKYLINEGFRQINFWGIPPGKLIRKCTTVFYRNNNCLGI